MINERRLINTFKKLVTIDSLSLQEGEVVAYLKQELQKLGFRPFLAGKPKGGQVGSLIINIPGRGETLLLNAHVDTVAPGKNIIPVEEGNYIVPKGRTILGGDNKAGVAVVLEVLRVIKEDNLSHPSLQVIFTVAEEIGLQGAKSLPKKLLKGKTGVVLDGGDVEEVIYKAPAQINITATILGRAAHAGIRPEEGISAIRVASEAISRMKLGRIDKETTANIGIIKGGEATNIIPDEVFIKGEARSHDPVKLKKQVKQMETVLRQACARHKARLKLKLEPMYQSFELKKKSEIMDRAVAALKLAGVKPLIKQTGGGSDANIFNQLGIPSVIMGVGMDRVHTTKERVKIKDMVKGAEVLLNLIRAPAND